MKIGIVAFDKKFGMPAYGSDHPVVVEAILEGDETPEQAWSEMNRRMIAWHRGEYPHLYQDGGETLRQEASLGLNMFRTARESSPPIGPQSPQVIDYRLTEELEISIDNAQTIDELKSIKEQNPIMPAKLIDQYNKRLKELTNG